MGALGAAEQLEFAQVRDSIISRVQELEDKVSYGTLTAEEKERILSEEFGPDYLDVVRGINSMLHPKRHPSLVVPHVKEAALLIFLLATITIIAAFVYPGILGAAINEQTVKVGVQLLPGNNAPIPFRAAMTLTSVEAAGEGPYTITITDRTATRTLLVSDGKNAVCHACGEKLEPPYLLELEHGQEVTVRSVTIR